MEPIFNAHVARSGLADRLRFTAGNFFADPLPSADVLSLWAYFMIGISTRSACCWTRPTPRGALPKGGALVVFDAIIDDDGARTHLDS